VRPVPGFGDPEARIFLVGLAPAAHGGNRTGRVFTGDSSGDFLFRALHTVGLADRPVRRDADDGLRLFGVGVAAAVRCAPKVIVALGAIGWDASPRALDAVGHPTPRPRPRFAHGAETSIRPTESTARHVGTSRVENVA
jgi:uracil-DNA glycosylase